MMSKTEKSKLSPGEIHELAGRMYECVDIELAIESGQLDSLESVQAALRARSEAINEKLRAAGAYDGVRILTPAEFNEAGLEVDQHMLLAGLDVSGLTPQ